MAGETISTTMQAAVLMGHGGPENLVVRDDWPVPSPAPGEVLVKIGAAGVNNTDIWTRQGAYGDPNDPSKRLGWRGVPLDFPLIQGIDAAGRIVGVGEGVPEARIGERVLLDSVLYDPATQILYDSHILGSERDGGFAEYIALPAENAAKIETSMTDAELASFPCAHLTGEHMLNRARVVAGETVLVTGASGGVGSALVQLVRARGAKPIAVVGRGKEHLLADLDPERVILREDGVLTQIERNSVDVVADLVGGTQFPDLLDALKPEGRYVTAGAIAGPHVALDLRTLYLKHLEAIGSTVWTRDEFHDLVAHIEAGRLKPLLAKTYPLSEIHQAQTDFDAKGFFGKLVLIPGR